MSSSNSKSPIFPGGAPGKPLLPGRPELPGPPAALTPSAPIITGFSSDSGVVGDGTTNDSTLTISGTAQAIYAGATIELIAGVVVDGLPFPLGPTGSDLIGTAVLGSDGTWSIDVDLSSFQGFDVDVQFVALLTIPSWPVIRPIKTGTILRKANGNGGFVNRLASLKKCYIFFRTVFFDKNTKIESHVFIQCHIWIQKIKLNVLGPSDLPY